MVAALTLIFLLAQAPVPIAVEDDRKTIPEPKERKIAYYYDYSTAEFFEPIGRFVDMPRNARRIFHSPNEARNVTALDDVSDSSWFTNRNFTKSMSPEQIRDASAPPAKAPDAGPWTVTKCKSDGVMPGFQVKDHKGDTYILKFDPAGYLEMATGAEVVASRLAYAAGYNVPENYIVTFNERILVPKADLTCSGSNLGKFTLTPESIGHFLEEVPRTRTGQLRAVASRFIEGKIKGPFAYQGIRDDDPNDRVPHEHRRELRGLRMIQAFLNNVDVKQLNTLDSYVEEGGQKFLKHYLIDFGDALGSGSVRPKEAGDGQEYIFDPGEVLKSAFTFGLHRRADTRLIRVQFPSIGYIEDDSFDPLRWKSNSPNNAFANMTTRDGYWGAKIVAAFSDEQIAAAVHAGQYSDPAAERSLIEIMKRRRDRMAGYWFHRVAPLDRFRLTAQGLEFDDLALESKLDRPENVTYSVIVRSTNTAPLSTAKPGKAIPIEIHDTPAEAQITRVSPGWPELKVTLTVQLLDGKPAITGIRR